MSPNPTTFAVTRTPLVDPKTGMGTWTFIKKMQEYETKLTNAITLLGEIAAAAVIENRTEGIGITVAQLNSLGLLINADQVAADGSSFVRVNPNQRQGGANAFIGLDSSGDVQRDVKTDRVVEASVKALALSTGKVQDNAITANASSTTAGSSTIDTTETIFNTITVVSGGAEVGIWASAGLRNVNGNIPKLRIRKDDVLGAILYTATPVPVSDNLFQVSLQGFDNAPTGSQIYVLTGELGNATGDILERSIFAINTKK